MGGLLAKEWAFLIHHIAFLLRSAAHATSYGASNGYIDPFLPTPTYTQQKLPTFASRFVTLKKTKNTDPGGDFLMLCGSCWRLEETIPAPWLVWVFKNPVMWLYLWEPQIPCALGRDWMDIFRVVLYGSLGRIRKTGKKVWVYD